tara:strand:- start:458 stop:580 length:123 start_codon:yes stop_codon:yes gene_type:complete
MKSVSGHTFKLRQTHFTHAPEAFDPIGVNFENFIKIILFI